LKLQPWGDTNAAQDPDHIRLPTLQTPLLPVIRYYNL
jgi:hypothetical protein